MKKHLTICLLTAAALVLLLLSACQRAVSIKGTIWTPAYANNASGDEVAPNEIYTAHYSNYQGTLSFEENGTFELWLSPGDPTDGTHTGTYEVEENAVSVLFDDGTQSQYDIVTKGDTQYIVVPYGEYKVYFCKL